MTSIGLKKRNFRKKSKFFKICATLAFMKEYILLLKSQSVLRRLSLIQLITYFGAWFSNVAIYTLLIELNVSAEIIGFVAMLHFLSGVVQAPFSGAIIDRFAPKKLMLFLIFLESVATLCLLFIDALEELPFLYLLIFVKMAAASFYFTTEMSLLPKILKAKKLQKANELHSIIWSLSYTFGMAISGFAVYILGVKAAFVFDAFLFLIAFLLLFGLPLSVESFQHTKPLLGMMRESIVYMRTNPKALHLMFLHAFVGLTAFDALVALMVESYYASIIATSLALGLMHASRAVGLVVGPVVLGKWINNRRLLYVFVAQGVAVWLWAFVMEYFVLSLLASVVVGFFTTTLWSYTYTLLQKNIDESYYGRIVAYNDMLFLSTAAFTSYMIGFLSQNNFSLQAIAILIGFGFIIGALYYNYIFQKERLDDI
jgi:MFS family permease